MTDERQLERAARRWLEQGPTQAPMHTIQAVLVAVAVTPPERRQRSLARLLQVHGLLRVAAVLAVAAIVVSVTIGPFLLRRWADPELGGRTPYGARLPPTNCGSGLPPSGSIATILGTGIRGSKGDDGPGLSAQMAASGGGIAVDASGNVYFTDAGTTGASSVRRLSADGIVTTIASQADGAPFRSPSGLAVDAAGNLYVADYSLSRIFRIDPTGTVTTVAGTGASGTDGDGRSALSATIQPVAVAADARGDLYFDDLNRYRSVDPAGIIRAFAGTGVVGLSGDSGPAVDARLGLSVMGVATDGRGNVYVGDPANHRIRKVDPTGIITTIAGNGRMGQPGENVSAIQTPIGSPLSLAADPDGSIFFLDNDASQVRRIDPDGMVATVAGSNLVGYAGDCGAATAAKLGNPYGLAARNGVLYIMEEGNSRIRIVVP
jgi:sugar lactone lactonase YvrE